MLQTCVIGLGPMGRNHARVLAEMPGVAVVGTADLEAEGAHRDYRALLEMTRPDAVVVAVPTALHREVTCAALAAGAHVLVEKPIASTLAEADAMIEAARRAGKQLVVGHVERFNPVVLALRDAMGGARIHQMLARRIGPLPPRPPDVGVTLDLSTHDIDVMHLLTGQRVVRARAETARRLGGEHEDLLAALLRFEGGAVGLLDVHRLGPVKVRELTVVTDAGTYVANYLAQTLHHNGTELLVVKREPLRVEHEAFVRCIEDGSEPFASAAAGRAALDVALQLLA